MEIVFVLIAGWLIAYGINYCSDVLPVSRRFSPAVCMHCGAQFSLIEFVRLQPCRVCHQRRSVRTWVIQVVFSAAVLTMWFYPPGRLGFWVGSGLLAFFGLIAVIDIEHRLILHPVSICGAIVGVTIGIWQKGLIVTLLGGAAGFGIMFSLYYLGSLFARWMAKMRHEETVEDALGFGDVNLAGIIGLMLGWPEIVGGLLVAILIGGLVSGLLMLGMSLARRYRALVAIPYAPFLLLGAIIFLYIPKQ